MIRSVHYCAPPSVLRDARSIQDCSWLVGNWRAPGPALALELNAIEDDARTSAAAAVFAIFVNMISFPWCLGEPGPIPDRLHTQYSPRSEVWT
jgi:hypothetical protein